MRRNDNGTAIFFMGLITLAVLAFFTQVVLGAANINDRERGTRFDDAAAWCYQFDNDPRLTYYLVEGDRVLFSRSCSNYRDLRNLNITHSFRGD